jgi:RNAse (barnase) inhibitor barstar
MSVDPFASAAAGAVIRSDMRAGATANRLHHVGWRVAVMRDGGVTHAQVLAAIGRALDFPDHYGQNLDALWDCLTDLTEPTALVWSDWQDAAVADPGDWARIMQVLRERTDEEPAFALVLCAPDLEELDGEV